MMYLRQCDAVFKYIKYKSSQQRQSCHSVWYPSLVLFLTLKGIGESQIMRPQIQNTVSHYKNLSDYSLLGLTDTGGSLVYYM